MTTINLNLVTHFVILDRQVDIHFGSSIVTVTGSNRYLDPLIEKIKSPEHIWVALDNDNYTSVNVYPLGSEEPHYK